MDTAVPPELENLNLVESNKKIPSLWDEIRNLCSATQHALCFLTYQIRNGQPFDILPL